MSAMRKAAEAAFRFLYNENHSQSEWFREAYGGE